MSIDAITNIKQILNQELANIDSIITNYLTSEEEVISLISHYLIEPSGKRIRPILTIIVSKMFGYNGNDNIKLASAIEMIHAATLLHDDVIDASEMRRFKATSNIIWGNKLSILVGDFLLSKAFALAIDTNSISSLRILSKSTVKIAEGEIFQLAKLNERKILKIDEYEKIILSKTAELFGTSCEIGAILAGEPDSSCETLKNFGLYLGAIFQISDDSFDYFSNKNEIGKNIGKDFLEGIVTLPLIFLYDKVAVEEKTMIIDMIQAKTRSINDFELVCALLNKHKIQQEITNYLLIIKSKANKLLAYIQIENIYKTHLISLLEFAMHRYY